MKPESDKSINPDLPKKHRSLRSVEAYVKGILAGDRIILSQAITLIESTRPEHRLLAQDIIEACLTKRNASIRIGITGSPGVGKSTFIEAFGTHLIEKGHRLAVLAIDPTSQISKGSILGDKTRMAKLASNKNAFIRPSAAGDSLGGVARKTREAILLCEAAGFDTIIIETVGVGQSETAVHSMVDCFLLLLLPGAGDELQGIKRGIVEMADILAVNKADGERLALAKRTQQEYRNALHFFPIKASGWTPPVLTCSATNNEGIAEIWYMIEDFWKFTVENGYFEHNRQEQSRHWLHETILTSLRAQFYGNESIKVRLKEIEKQVLEGKLSTSKGAEELLNLFLKKDSDKRRLRDLGS
ncbi:MAG: methylmalonyl Co-A mutase-associated GTPase MeaB [Saprospiraceae bacterium]|nr:methylmalonyl Co-A mutase-associated GTPase MeaB [Saprospiraceae bacterium]